MTFPNYEFGKGLFTQLNYLQNLFRQKDTVRQRYPIFVNDHHSLFYHKSPGTHNIEHMSATFICKIDVSIFLALTGEAYWPVESVEDEVEGGEEASHPLVDDPSTLLAILLLLRRVVFLQVEPYTEEVLHPVNNDFWNLMRVSWTP